jgi:hypothetical protein
MSLSGESLKITEQRDSLRFTGYLVHRNFNLASKGKFHTTTQHEGSGWSSRVALLLLQPRR